MPDMDVQSAGGSSNNNSSDFVRKLYKMLEDPSYESVVRWGNDGDSFVVLENEKFTKSILPKHFKHSNFASFVRQLNKYDFHKVRHNNEESGNSQYGSGAWEFKHPDFKANNKDALENIRRKAPVSRKPNMPPEEIVPTQQIDLVNTQLGATQQQLQTLQERYNELHMHHSMLLQEVIGLQKTVVNHEHVIQNVMNFLHSVDSQRRRESRVGSVNPFAQSGQQSQNGMPEAGNQIGPSDENGDEPASPLANADKLLSELNADNVLNSRNLEQMNELAAKINGSITTPPPTEAVLRHVARPASRGPPASASSASSARYGDLDHMVYPVGQTNGIDPMYSEHIHNIPYPMPSKPAENTEPRYQQQPEARKKNSFDPGWIRQPHILLVEDDPTCRRIGGRFLYAFNCQIDSALDGLEAVNKMNAGNKYDLVLMDIIMPNLDGVSACHLIRQFDQTPIIAMTSNIRSDDISMYFQHGMNDVLPKPFTKEGLIQCLDKHLNHLKKGAHEGMGVHGSSRASLKDEGSPSASPVTLSTHWNSPGQITGVSPTGEQLTEDQILAQRQYGMNSGGYSIDGGMSQMGYGHSNNPTTPLSAGPRPGPGQPQGSGHRRQISDISGGAGDPADGVKRQQMYPPMQLHQQGMGQMGGGGGANSGQR